MTARLVWLLIIALVLRLGAAVAVQTYLDRVAHREFLIPGDANGYWELGCKLARGEEFSIYEPPRRVMRMPGFPALLALSVRLFGENLFAARCLLAIVGAAACGLTYSLGRLLFDEQVAFAAGLLAAFSPALIGFSVEVLSEMAFGLALLGSLLLFARLMRGRWLDVQSSETPVMLPARYGLAFASGLGVAVATYFRPTWLLAGPLFAVSHVGFTASIWRDRMALKTATIEAAIVLIGLAVALAPWTYRNWQVTGHAIPTTLWVGPSLYDGLHPAATGDSDMQFFEDDQLLATMSEYEMDQEYRHRAVDFALAHPLRAVELGFIKLWRFWSPWPNAQQFRSWWMCVGFGAYFLLTIGLLAVGVRRTNFEPARLLLTVGPVVYFAAVHSVFIGSIRYRLPAEFPLLILSGVGLSRLQEWWKSRAHGGHSC